MLTKNERSVILLSCQDNPKLAAIKQAVLDLTLEEGYQNLSMSKIAKKAGVSPATIYLTYTSKEDMLTSLYLEARENLDSQMHDLGETQADIQTQIKKMYEYYIRVLLERPQQSLFMNVVNNNPTLINADVYDKMIRQDNGVRELLKKGQQQGVIKQQDVELLIAFTFFPLDDLLEMNYVAGRTTTDEMIKQMVDMCWSAIKA